MNSPDLRPQFQIYFQPNGSSSTERNEVQDRRDRLNSKLVWTHSWQEIGKYTQWPTRTIHVQAKCQPLPWISHPALGTVSSSVNSCCQMVLGDWLSYLNPKWIHNRANQSPCYQVHVWMRPLTRPHRENVKSWEIHELANEAIFFVYRNSRQILPLQHEEVFNEIYYNKNILLGGKCVKTKCYFKVNLCPLNSNVKIIFKKSFGLIYKKIFCIIWKLLIWGKEYNSDSIE